MGEASVSNNKRCPLMKKLLLVEDHAALREGLALLIRTRAADIEVLEAGSLIQALSVLSLHPDVALVLLDMALPDAQGVAALHQIRQRYATVPVMVLSAHDDMAQVAEALEAGARGFLSKRVDAQGLLSSVHSILSGQPGSSPASVMTTPPIEFSERQWDVLRLLVAGKPNKVISRELALSEATVKTHLQAVFRKLQVSTRTQAVVALSKLGLM